MHVWGYLGLRNFFPCIATNGEVAKPTIQVGGATISYDEYCRHAARVFSLSNADQRYISKSNILISVKYIKAGIAIVVYKHSITKSVPLGTLRSVCSGST